MTARTLPSAPTPQYGAPNLPITTTRRTAMDTATIPTEDEFAQWAPHEITQWLADAEAADDVSEDFIRQARKAVSRALGVDTEDTSARGTAFSLILTVALDSAVHKNGDEGGAPPANWEMYQDLTTALKGWQDSRELRREALTLAEWLATELCGYALQQHGGDQARLEEWIRDHGATVAAAQTHPHPAGPTAVEILSVVARGSQLTDQERVTGMAAPFVRYLRAEHELEDAREIALTLCLWAGEYLAGMMAYDVDRITGYVTSRLMG